MNTSCPPLARSILDVIGHTPLVELTRSVESRGLSGRLLVKLEYFSPGGSKKDRIALEIIREARASGELRPGQTVVELTSGGAETGTRLVLTAICCPGSWAIESRPGSGPASRFWPVIKISGGLRTSRARSRAGVSPLRTAAWSGLRGGPQSRDRSRIPASGTSRFRLMSSLSALSGEI